MKKWARREPDGSFTEHDSKYGDSISDSGVLRSGLMDREILFRGKLVGSGAWVYGGFHLHTEYTANPIVPRGGEPDVSPKVAYIIEDGFSDWQMPKPIRMLPVDMKTVGQFVGRLDINGNKVFEGDFINCENYHGKVQGSVQYVLSEFYLACSSGYSDEYLLNCSNLEVIGNLYDNPELRGDKDGE